MSNEEYRLLIPAECDRRSPGNRQQRGLTAASLIRPHGFVARADKTRGGFRRRHRRRYGT